MSAWSAGRRHPARAGSTSTSASSDAGPTRRSAAPRLALARDVERRMPGQGDVEMVEGGAPGRVPRLQPEREGPHRRVGVFGPPAARCARLDPAVLGRGAGLADPRPSRSRRSRSGSRRSAIPAPVSTRPSDRSTRCSSCRSATRPRAWATRPGRRTTRNRPANRHASSRRASGGPTLNTSPVRARPAVRRQRSPRNGRRRSPPGIGTPGSRPSGKAPVPPRPAGARPTCRSSRSHEPRRRPRRSKGFERWKSRHPEAATALEPADVLVDGMRGRSSLWYRVRVNLTHVPEADRPPQEQLDPDYDPWAGYEWPDRAGQLERAPRKKSSAS